MIGKGSIIILQSNAGIPVPPSRITPKFETTFRLFFLQLTLNAFCVHAQQEMSQTRDKCPQRNWSSIRHI